MTRLIYATGFVATVIAANWALNRYGIVTIAPGIQAPAGVYAAGLAFGLRDALHETGGRTWTLAAITTGTTVSYLVEDAVTIPGGHAPIAIASAAAFALSELADLAVYERIPSWWKRVALSNTVGAAIDSTLFLWLAFGALDHLAGQVVGKVLMVLPALALVWHTTRRRTLAAV